MEDRLKRKEPWFAAIMSLLLPGVGQIYCGKIERGVIFIIIGILLWFTIIGGIIMGIIAAIDAYNLAKDYNFQIEQEGRRKINDLEKEKLEKEKVEKLKDQEISVKYFTEALKKNYKLFTAEIFSEEEYKSKKDAIINNLATKKITCSIEDFLASLITLKEQKVLSKEEINKIKLLIL